MADTTFTLKLQAPVNYSSIEKRMSSKQFQFTRCSRHSIGYKISRQFLGTNIDLLHREQRQNSSNAVKPIAASLNNNELTSPATERTYTTVSEVSAFLRSTNTTVLPDYFVYPEASRSSIPYNGFSNETQLPIIDLSAVLDPANPDHQKCWETAAMEASEASKEWGFFEVINHGIPLDLIKTIESIGSDFFNQPAEQKEHCRICFLKGYEGMYTVPVGGTPWVEALTMNVLPESNVADLAEKMRPECNAMIRETMEEMAGHMRRLSITILKLLARGLGVEDEAYFSKHFEEGNVADMRYNYYPACPHPSLALGYPPHTDPNTLTILYQDQIGGLQIEAPDGSWFAVKPHKGALVVNIGDTLQGWSNGIFKSVLHRVVVNEVKHRISFGYFCSPPYDLAVQPPSRIANEDVSARYKPFTYSAYRTARFTEALYADPTKRLIDAFAGIEN